MIENQSKLIKEMMNNQKKLMTKIDKMEESINEISEENRKFTNCMKSKWYLLKKLREYYENNHILIEVKEEKKKEIIKEIYQKGI